VGTVIVVRALIDDGDVFRRYAVVSRVRAESAAPPRTSSPEAKESLWHARNIAAVREARRAVRATALIKAISKSSPILDIVFAYGYFDFEICSRAALRNKLGYGIEVWGGGISRT